MNDKASVLMIILIGLVVLLVVVLGVVLFFLLGDSDEVGEGDVSGNELDGDGGSQVVCVESWDCSGWGECIAEEQDRVCVDLNDCGTYEGEPYLVQGCEVEEDPVIELIDCGTETLVVEAGLPVSHDRTEQVQAVEDAYAKLVCFGEALLDDCKESKIQISSSGEDLGVFESRGLDGDGNCIGRTTISEDVASGETKYVGTYVDCPLNAIDIDLGDSFFETHPANLGLESIFSLKLFNFHEGSDQCSGTFFEA
tara:strand:- start:3304 stop:4062 length:759 start_codon:yes stop_codon:yes gene_type:complete